jgi:ADP-ribosylglycohydrolase
VLGAIAGDIIGSVYEFAPIKTTDFPLFEARSCFTDDTVLTVAVAFALMTDRDYASALRMFGRLYPLAGYGGFFNNWLAADWPTPYGSYGNGSAMRVSPIGFGCASEAEVLEEARRSAEVTHNHPEGIKGAQATALAVYMCRRGATKQEIRREIMARFGYRLDRTLDEIRPSYSFDQTCPGTIPPAFAAFLAGVDYEQTVRLAVSLGGDADTLACIAGGLAHAFHGEVPAAIAEEVRRRLPADLLEIVDDFEEFCRR